MFGMLLWTCSFLCFFDALHSLRVHLVNAPFTLSFTSQQRKLLAVVAQLRELEELLLAGLVPSPQKWDDLLKLSAPWNKLSHQSLVRLRQSGGSLLPTLGRLRDLASDQEKSIAQAKSKTSQALAQAIICAAFVPIVGIGMLTCVPGIQNHLQTWLIACATSLVLTTAGCLWMLKLAESARWGNLPVSKRSWMLGAQCCGESFLAQVRSGTPPDLAWTGALEGLSDQLSSLSLYWGHTVWEEPQQTQAKAQSLERLIQNTGSALKKSIQVSLMEGRPCTQRVEAALLSLRRDAHSLIENELALLATRSLKPLFICVAPSILGLLAYAMTLIAFETVGLQDIFGI